jgi:hypothetical protein
MSRFKKFVGKLKAEGYSENSARKIAAVEGAKKYGWTTMEERSRASRERHANA